MVLESKEIFDKAVADFKPHVTVLMFSGGDDSLTTYHVSRELGIKFDFVIHGNTRTGIKETTDFVIRETERNGDKLLLADAGDAYERYVMRKGFFGKGLSAHAMSYHILKQDHFERVVSHNIVKRKRGVRTMFINGARRQESANRLITMASPYKITKRRPNDMWANLINEFTKEDCKDYLSGNAIVRNPVSVNLCRSGECMCGTMQTDGDRQEAGFFYPAWKKWLDHLEAKVKMKHGFGWNDNKKDKKELFQGDLFQPMCVGCKMNENAA